MCWFETSDECDVAWWAAFRSIEGVVFVEVNVFGPRNDTANAVGLSLELDRRQENVGAEPRASAS